MKCLICNKNTMLISPAQSGAGDVLYRCPQHHWYRVDGTPVAEPGTDAFLHDEVADLVEDAPKKKAAKKKAAKKKA